MKSTADQVISALVHAPFHMLPTHALNRLDSKLDGAYIALVTHGYTPDELLPLRRMMVECRSEIENRYCGAMMISMENLNHIKKLKLYAQAIGTFFARYKEKSSQSNCDKHEARFNGDERFKVFKVHLTFTAYTGFYGNGSCSTMGSFDDKIMQGYMTRACNTHAELLFSEMAKLMNEDCQKHITDAEKEISELVSLIQDAK